MSRAPHPRSPLCRGPRRPSSAARAARASSASTTAACATSSTATRSSTTATTAASAGARPAAEPRPSASAARVGSGRGGGQLLLLLTRRSSPQDRPEGGFLPLLKMQLVSEPQPPREAQGGRGGLCLPLGNSAVSLTEAGCLGSAPAHAGGTLKPCSKCTKQHASGLASPTAEGKHP